MIKGIKSLVAGILAGTAVGVLFSPKKGKDVRESFKKEFHDGGSGLKTAKSTIHDMGKEMGDYYQEVSETEKFKKGKAKVKKYASSAKDEVKSLIKKNVPAKTLKKADHLLDEAKKTVDKAMEKVAKKLEKYDKESDKKKK